MHYVKNAFPEIFKDSGNVTTQLDAAASIQSLNQAQRNELERMASQFNDQYWALCESMIEIEESAAFAGKSEGMMPKGRIKRQINESKLRFERSELNDRIRMRLRMVLTNNQIKEVPGLRPSVTASAEKQY